MAKTFLPQLCASRACGLTLVKRDNTHMCTYDIPGWVAVSKSLLLSQSPLLHKFMIHLIMITSGGCSMASHHFIAYWRNNLSQ